MSPNQRRATTHQHPFWLEDDLWAAVQAKAAQEGVSVTALVREFLERYIQTTDRTEDQ